MTSSNNTPAMAAGTVAATKYHNIFPSSSFTPLVKPLLIILIKSLKKYIPIARRVPKWSAKSNVKARWASIPAPIPNKSLKIIKCADEDIGKNSAIPWINPKIIIDIKSIYFSPNFQIMA